MKKCNICNQKKEESEFYSDKATPSGLSYRCKPCDRERSRKWKQQNKEKHAASVAKWRKENPDKLKEQDKKRRQRDKVKIATRKQTQYAIRKGLLLKEPCQVCGTEESIEAHHEDYTKPLDIMWFCKKHHKEHHQKRFLKNG